MFERSPEELIREIILVDDNNDDSKIGSDLSKLDKVCTEYSVSEL